MANARQFMAARTASWNGKRLPYDAEVEWLECVGLQYIVTDYILSGEGNLFRAGYELKQSKESYLFGNQSGKRNGISILNLNKNLNLFL